MSTPNNPYSTPQHGQPTPAYGQPGMPFGNPGQPGQPFGQPGEPFGLSAPGHGEPSPFPPEKKKASWQGWTIFGVLIAAVVAFGGYSVWSSMTKGSEGPRTGNCVQFQASDNNKPKVLKCSDPAAESVVLERYNVAPGLRNCQGVAGATKTYEGYYRSNQKRQYYLLCLGPNTAHK